MHSDTVFGDSVTIGTDQSTPIFSFDLVMDSVNMFDMIVTCHDINTSTSAWFSIKGAFQNVVTGVSQIGNLAVVSGSNGMQNATLTLNDQTASLVVSGTPSVWSYNITVYTLSF